MISISTRKYFFALTSFAIIVVLSACNNQRSINSAFWNQAIGKLQDRVNKTAFRDLQNSSALNSISFFVSNEHWFAVILSINASDTITILPIIGYFEDNFIHYAYAMRPKLILDGDIDEYDKLLRADSLWSMVWEQPFWHSSDDFQRAYMAGMMRTTGDTTFGVSSAIRMDIRVD